MASNVKTGADEENPDRQGEAEEINRREALTRLARYTAPAMLVLLMSEPASSLTAAGPPILISDSRLKRDVAQVGQLPNGLGLYRYRYLWSDTVYVGVMAQEVAELAHDAVVQGADGYMRVDYARLGLSLQTWDEWVAAA